MPVRLDILAALCIAVGVFSGMAFAQRGNLEAERADALRRLRDQTTPLAAAIVPNTTNRGFPFELQWVLTEPWDQGALEASFNVLGEFLQTRGSGVSVLDISSITDAPDDFERFLESPLLSGEVGQGAVSVDSDLDGNAVVALTVRDAGNNFRPRIAFFVAGTSSPTWIQELLPPGLTGRSGEVCFTPDGGILATGSIDSNKSFAALIDPIFGGVAWYREFPNQYHNNTGFGATPLAFDGAGNVLLPLGDYSDSFFVRRLDLATGLDTWPIFVDSGTSAPENQKVRVGPRSGNTFVGLSPDGRTGVRVYCLGRDGEFLWDFDLTDTGSGGTLEFIDCTIGLDEACYILYYDDGIPAICKIRGDGTTQDNQPVWTYIAPDPLGQDDPNYGEILIGNFPGVYCFVPRGGASWIVRINENDGSLEWEYYQPFNSRSSLPYTFSIDGGGNVLAGGVEQEDDGSYYYRLRKFSQPTGNSVTTSSANPRLYAAQQDIWVPGSSIVSAEDLYLDLPLGFDFDVGGCTSVPFLGEFGGGLNADVQFRPKLGYRVEASGGTVDIDLPVDVTWSIPPRFDLLPGSTAVIETTSRVNPAARMTSNTVPNMAMGLTGGLDAGIELGMALKLFAPLFDATLVDEFLSIPPQFIPYLNSNDLYDYIGFPAPGETFSFEILVPTRIKVTLRRPVLAVAGRYSNGRIEDVIDKELFFRAEANTTRLLTSRLPDGFPSLDYMAGFDQNGFSGSLSYGLAQSFLDLDLDVNQTLDLIDIVPMVEYEFSDGIPSIVQRLDEPLVFTMPADVQVEVKPTVYAEARLSHKAAVELTPRLRWEVFRFMASFSAGPWELISANECFECDSIPIADLGELILQDDDWYIRLGDVEVCPFNVVGTIPTGPTLVGSSRSALDVILYDQTSPTPASFNVITSRSTKMLLYGESFEPLGSGAGTRVFLRHHGRSEELDVNVLNDRTMLVEVPNRFRVLPGVARLMVLTDFGVSRTLDIPMCLPTPRLDTVNPNLWAADPSLADVPIQVLDKKTERGSDTFIARRDYFKVMRDDLWSNFTAFGFTAEEFFPDFDFEQLPPIPQVIFNGEPLARFVQPVENGILNTRLSSTSYSSPRIVDVSLCSPGPGGGASVTKQLQISAPKPVASVLDPATVEPGGELPPNTSAMVLRVSGPENVPYWDGYEEPKFGNFNSESVVYFDGIAVDTEFFSSSELRAHVPAALVQHPRRVYVSVFTPANGTSYLERLVDGNGNVVLFDNIPSGGFSAPIPFDIRFRDPEIHGTNPEAAEAGSAVFDLRDPDNNPYNISVFGNNFREGCVAYVDGQPRLTLVEGRGLARIQLLPQDVLVAGKRELILVNPGNQSSRSESYFIPVSPPAQTATRHSVP